MILSATWIQMTGLSFMKIHNTVCKMTVILSGCIWWGCIQLLWLQYKDVIENINLFKLCPYTMINMFFFCYWENPKQWPPNYFGEVRKVSCSSFLKSHSEYPWVTSSFDMVVFHLSWDTPDMHPAAYSSISVAYNLASCKPKATSNHHEHLTVDDVPQQ